MSDVLPEFGTTVPPEMIPTTPVLPPASRHGSPLWPMLTGAVIVFVVAGILGGGYYLTKIKQEIAASPSPAPTAIPSPSPTPSPTPTTTPSVSPTPSRSPTPTPVAAQPTTFDLRFANPAAHVRQTYDDGSGEGRVINREYSSAQTGTFDEVKATWSPRVTACFHFVVNENVAGSQIKYRLTLGDKTEVEDNFSGYGDLTAGRVYDWCHDVTTDLGTHTVKLTLNPDKSLKDSNYNNDLARIDYTNLSDNIAPNFTLMGPNDENGRTCLFPQYITDNVTPYTELKIEQKVDSTAWATFSGDRYCFDGDSGDPHTFAIRITDGRGNQSQQSKAFNLF